jgi:hypothetical protein
MPTHDRIHVYEPFDYSDIKQLARMLRDRQADPRTAYLCFGDTCSIRVNDLSDVARSCAEQAGHPVILCQLPDLRPDRLIMLYPTIEKANLLGISKPGNGPLKITKLNTRLN